MKKQPDYTAADNIEAAPAADPYLRPAFSLKSRLARLAWNVTWAVFYRLSPRPFYAWRAMLLRLFGAKIGAASRFYPGSRVWAPWMLTCEQLVAVADGAEIYNPAPMFFGSHAIVSQGAYLCGATHDLDDPAFPLLAYAMNFGSYSWVCARAIVGPGVDLGEGAVLGLASVATRTLAPWTVYAGSPAAAIRERRRE